MTKQRNDGKRAVSNRYLRALLRNQRSVFAIIAVVLIFVILISSLSSCSRKRKQEETVTTLQNTISQLQEDNHQLQSELEAESQAAEAYRQALASTVRVMDLFWQIDEAYVLNRTSRCRELIRMLEAEALIDFLPTTSTTNNGRFSPYDRYVEICEALGEPYGSAVTP